MSFGQKIYLTIMMACMLLALFAGAIGWRDIQPVLVGTAVVMLAVGAIYNLWME